MAIGMILVGLVVCLFLPIFAVKSIFFPSAEKTTNNSPITAPAAVNQVDDSPAATGKTTILLLGSDQREDDPGYRTDVIILLLVDADNKTVSAVSFPRDLWVNSPDLSEMKINQIEGLGGFDAMANMFESNFGVRPDYYVLTNFAGFTNFIDKLGGIDVPVEQTLTDDCDLPQAVDGDCTVEPGQVTMDGATALWYARSRHTTSDLDRLRRAQEILFGVFNKVMTIGAIQQIPDMMAIFSEDIETNLDAQTMLSFLSLANEIYKDPARITHYAITEDQAAPSWSWNGLWILLPDSDKIHELLVQAGFFTE